MGLASLTRSASGSSPDLGKGGLGRDLHFLKAALPGRRSRPWRKRDSGGLALRIRILGRRGRARERFSRSRRFRSGRANGSFCGRSGSVFREAPRSRSFALGTLAASRVGFLRTRSRPRRARGSKMRKKLNGRQIAPRPEVPEGLQAGRFADNAGARPPRTIFPARFQSAAATPPKKIRLLPAEFHFKAALAQALSGCSMERTCSTKSPTSLNWR